ncbi:Hypothetical predicted protein [Podarcis lilfordi]|uniref:Uncharacterized protein n=1 Tax=Podarcis lilfordi TaxID=74358 RepID=A0AA35L276_9SAUR|nr:Hypothetical predicted protein [Podarcis lilfordi]
MFFSRAASFIEVNDLCLPFRLYVELHKVERCPESSSSSRLFLILHKGACSKPDKIAAYESALRGLWGRRVPPAGDTGVSTARGREGPLQGLHLQPLPGR